jgi:hypothetical protein
MFSELSQITEIVASASNPRTARDLRGRHGPLPCPLTSVDRAVFSKKFAFNNKPGHEGGGPTWYENLDTYAYKVYIAQHGKEIANDRIVIPCQAPELEVRARDGARQP